MSKWALIFDEKPETCETCPVFKHGICKKEQKWIIGGGKECPDWCPLKELPEFEINNYVTDDDIECLEDGYEISTAYMVGHEAGWNDCLLEIEGENNEQTNL